MDEILNSALVSRIAEQLPAREKQVELLLTLLDKNGAFPSVCAVGPGSSGKSATVRAVLQECGLWKAWVACPEVYNTSLLFDTILTQLASSVNPSNGEQPPRCDDMPSFVDALAELITTKQSQPAYIVLDEVEYLLKVDHLIIPAFLQLRELCGCDQVCIILTTELPWEKFLPCLPPPIFVPFPAYSREELELILIAQCPDDCSKSLFSNYVKVVLAVFLPVTRDLTELKHLVSLHFAKYCEPIEDGEVGADDVLKLWKRMEPVLKRAVHTVYLREVASCHWEEMQKENMDAMTPSQCRAAVELPFYSKFLLLASYLGSYNPPRTDAKFFLKDRFRKRKVMKRVDEPNFHILGPKAVPQDRLFAIFYTIVEEKVPQLALLASQLSSLVTLRLIARVSQDDHLACPKYKCLVELDLILQIARTVNFDLVAHLNDFN